MTKGKRCRELLEGVNIREIGAKLQASINERGLPAEVINLDPVDTGLKCRVKYSNDAHRRMKNIVHVPLHHNAQRTTGGNWGTARGARILYYPTAKASKAIAEKIAHQFRVNTRLGGRTVPHRWLYELRATKGPAALVEAGFMTNMLDNEYLMSEQGQNDIVNALCESVEVCQYD
jgi:N-acetylmuramoyl-L-alanine amidase